jgi:transposase InsO family protein
LNSKDAVKNKELLDIMTFESQRLSRTYGYRRMKILLAQKYSVCVNHKKLRRLMKQYNLLAIIRRKKNNKMYRKGKEGSIAPNLLNRCFQANNPGEKYATDITYIPIPNGMTYLSAAIDLYNNEVVEYKVSKSSDASLSVDVIKALKNKRNVKGSIIHSDQGIHYTNNEYAGLLKELGIHQSMSRKGNCWDNACMESFFGHFKCECVKIQKKALKSFRDVVEIVDYYIDFYNNERIQSRLNKMAPIEYRNHFSLTS